MIPKNKKAFTITELVVVIAVIAILAAILIPTFSEVIDNSKKSHDAQLVKNLNTALSVYKAETGKDPETYDDLMLALSQQGLTDTTNPFLLATALKQDNMYLVWYENANFVTLIDQNDSQYNVSFTPSFGLGNGVTVYNRAGEELSRAYLLCTIGESDGPYIAGVYYDFYVMSGGDITKFQTSFSGKYGDLADKVTDKMWGNTIVAAINNQKLGYTYSETIATDIETQTINSNVISLEMPEVGATIEGGGTVTVEQQAQVMRATMATLSTMSNEDSTAEKLAGKKVVFGDGEDSLKDVVVSFSEVSPTAISATHRDVVTANVPSGFSVDFGGVTITGYELDAQFVPQGAQYQTEDDNEYPQGAYNYSYGLFGTVIAKAGETVKISNINVKDVRLDLNERTITVDGKSGILSITDSAGIIAGCVLGDAEFDNIHIDGANENGEVGYIKGYDAVAGIVGRAYGKFSATHTVKITDSSVKNLEVYGQRKVAGIIAISGQNSAAIVDNVSLENVKVTANRNLTELDPNSGDSHAGILCSHMTTDIAATAETVETVKFTKINIVNCETINTWVDKDKIKWKVDGVYFSLTGKTELGTDKNVIPTEFLKLTSSLNGINLVIENLTVDGVAVERYEKPRIGWMNWAVILQKAE